MREFPTGATRDSDLGKPDYEGYLAPIVLWRFGQYMMKHQTQADGTRRASDNWQRGITKDAYMKSAFRHFMDVWLHHRDISVMAKEPLEEALCALMFNVMGYLFEELHAEEEV